MFTRRSRGPRAERHPESHTVGHLLTGTLPGRALVVGAAIRLVAWLGQVALGPTAVLQVIGTIGTLALLAGLSYFAWRLVAVARRRLLWRVRRKLILSYIFVGLVPALLIIIFFALCGLLLFGSVSSYVVQTRLRSLTEQAQFYARTTVIELARAASRDDLQDRLARKQASLETRFPDASFAVVPVSRACASDAGAPPPGVTPREPMIAGPWPHVEPPRGLAAWIGCSGFSGVLAYSSDPAADSRVTAGTAGSDDTGTRLFVRAAVLPDGPAPRYALILDVPLTDLMALRLREETGIELRAITVMTSGGGPLPMPGRPGAPAVVRAAAPERGSLTPSWVVFLDYTDWLSGRTGRATLAIDMSIGEIYERLAPSRFGDLSFGQVLVLVIVIVGLLFLLIQFVALVMGLGLARSITGSVHELFVGTERVRQGDFSHQIQVKARDQLGELADSFNSMTARLGQLLAEMAEKKRLEEELRIARSIQMSLLPQNPPVSMPGIVLSALCNPAREVGGDYYDFLPLGDDRLGLLIADVSGKGTSAALYMAELKGLMLSLTQIHRSPRELLIAANRIISDNLDSRSFITMTYAVVDLAARTMTFARAGHTPLIHVPGRGQEPRRARILVSDGLVLGLKIDNGEKFGALLQEVTIPLESGDLFVFFTDGLSEQMDPEDELFGEARLGALVEEHGDLPFDELRERIVREVRAFAGSAPQHDDMTFILLRVQDPPAALQPPAGRIAEAVVS